MNFINNLSMRGKLITLVVPALLVIMLFAIGSITENAAEYRNMSQLQAMVNLAEMGDPLVETLQKERGRSAVALATEPRSDAEQQAWRVLESQRQQTNAALSDYRSELQALLSDTSFDGAVTESIDRLETELNRLTSLRKDVDRRSLNGSEAASRYTGLVTEIVDRVPCWSVVPPMQSLPVRSTPITPWHKPPRWQAGRGLQAPR